MSFRFAVDMLLIGYVIHPVFQGDFIRIHQVQNSILLNRVVVTGIGAVTPLGLSIEESWQELVNGKSGIQKITRFNTEKYKVKIAAEVKNFQATNYIEHKNQKKMDLFIQYAIAASAMALEKSGLQSLKTLNERAGVIVGTSVGGVPKVEEQHQRLLKLGPDYVSPFYIPSVLGNMASAQIAIRNHIHGPQFGIKSACATGTHAIGEAYRYIRDGTCDVMICGGTDSAICPLTVAGFQALDSLSMTNDQPELASRPWDKNRNGFVLGEGACVFVLESLQHALNRGASILAEVSGYAATSDAYHITAPSEDGYGLNLAIQLILKQSGLKPTDISCINAHAASTRMGDSREFNTYKKIFAGCKDLDIVSNKGQIGHCLAAAGAIESAFSVLTLANDIIPFNLNFNEHENQPNVDFCIVKTKPVSKPVEHVLKCSVGFGGTNACLLFSKFN